MRALVKYIITLVVGLGFAAWIAFSRDILEQTQLVNIYHILCDSFFVVGFLITAIGLLIFVSNEGAFDPIVYGMRSFINIFKKREKRKMETYYDFRTARSAHKFSFLFLVICGVVLLAVSGVMYALYSKEYTALCALQLI